MHQFIVSALVSIYMDEDDGISRYMSRLILFYVSLIMHWLNPTLGCSFKDPSDKKNVFFTQLTWLTCP